MVATGAIKRPARVSIKPKREVQQLSFDPTEPAPSPPTPPSFSALIQSPSTDLPTLSHSSSALRRLSESAPTPLSVRAATAALQVAKLECNLEDGVINSGRLRDHVLRAADNVYHSTTESKYKFSKLEPSVFNASSSKTETPLHSLNQPLRTPLQKTTIPSPDHSSFAHPIPVDRSVRQLPSAGPQPQPMSPDLANGKALASTTFHLQDSVTPRCTTTPSSTSTPEPRSVKKKHRSRPVRFKHLSQEVTFAVPKDSSIAEHRTELRELLDGIQRTDNLPFADSEPMVFNSCEEQEESEDEMLNNSDEDIHQQHSRTLRRESPKSKGSSEVKKKIMPRNSPKKADSPSLNLPIPHNSDGEIDQVHSGTLPRRASRSQRPVEVKKEQVTPTKMKKHTRQSFNSPIMNKSEEEIDEQPSRRLRRGASRSKAPAHVKKETVSRSSTKKTTRASSNLSISHDADGEIDQVRSRTLTRQTSKLQSPAKVKREQIISTRMKKQDQASFSSPISKKRRATSEVLKLQKALETAVWTNSESVHQQDEVIVISDSEEDVQGNETSTPVRSSRRRRQAAVSREGFSYSDRMYSGRRKIREEAPMPPGDKTMGSGLKRARNSGSEDEGVAPFKRNLDADLECAAQTPDEPPISDADSRAAKTGKSSRRGKNSENIESQNGRASVENVRSLSAVEKARRTAAVVKQVRRRKANRKDQEISNGDEDSNETVEEELTSKIVIEESRRLRSDQTTTTRSGKKQKRGGKSHTPKSTKYMDHVSVDLVDYIVEKRNSRIHSQRKKDDEREKDVAVTLDEMESVEFSGSEKGEESPVMRHEKESGRTLGKKKNRVRADSQKKRTPGRRT